MLKFVQSSKDSRLELAVGKLPVMHMSEACREDEQSRQLEHYRTKSPVWQFCLLATQSSREAKSPASSILKNLALCIPFSLQYKYSSYPRNIESFQREY